MSHSSHDLCRTSLREYIRNCSSAGSRLVRHVENYSANLELTNLSHLPIEVGNFTDLYNVLRRYKQVFRDLNTSPRAEMASSKLRAVIGATSLAVRHMEHVGRLHSPTPVERLSLPAHTHTLGQVWYVTERYKAMLSYWAFVCIEC
ncbi:uncharacterized protein LOC106072269 isoform X2 [Biomphalaria glabrata]|nr:uncharacterized protein LOC106072269 isoform X2 [Biomphalaria glabrata]KAI8755376.1 hypothetical protein BgiMline_011466 [Biomphalaria glabrata]